MTNAELIKATRDNGMEPILDRDGNVIGAVRRELLPTRAELIELAKPPQIIGTVTDSHKS